MSSAPRASSTTQACAACKYQRRKCAPDCILAPYFPHDRQKQFLNAHKLFGVSNITKIIKNLNPPDKDIAMRTIIFQSDARANDPVGGCYSIIRELQRQLDYHQAELELVLHHLAVCRAQTVAAHQQSHSHRQLLHDQSHNNINVAPENIVNVQDPFGAGQMTFVQEPSHQEQVQQYLPPGNDFLQENDLNVHESSTALSSEESNTEDLKPAFDMSRKRHDINFEHEDNLIEQRFAPSTQLVISS